jgi:flagellar protein FliS
MTFATTRRSAQAYARVGIETGVQGASPHQLILMLYDGALFSLGIAEREMCNGNMEQKGKAVSRAIDIIGQGLQASLDDRGGDLAANLFALYDYMMRRLVQANLDNDPEILQEVARLLRDLKGAWEEIADDPAVLSPNKPAA